MSHASKLSFGFFENNPDIYVWHVSVWPGFMRLRHNRYPNFA
ncbi:hypothetical protein SMB34_21130 [Thalassospira permensis NBRC 106175]|uniref:Uncharacterized protein n=1 Tax=Thalassospira permensis NBRC 106175 TaxID=1353532 RepID=A0ABR4TK13_9PROT|nr:hypothetical protein SMB34_21130 [Thalassospira permensis NBRC 106175]